MIGRKLNVVVACWLILSAVGWRHDPAQQINTLACGVAAAAIALAALRVPWVRYCNTLLAVWLFMSPWVLGAHSPATYGNDAIVACLLFSFSLMGGGPEARAADQAGAP